MSHPIPQMVMPSQKRPGIWNSGVMQVWVGRMCNRACYGCTQGSQLAGKPGMISVDQYEQAIASLNDYWGTVGMFGGLATLHPRFPELCLILKGSDIPWHRRGLWANDINGHGAICRQTFNPACSNLNVHMDSEAADEIRRDWPEAAPFIKGEEKDSVHGTPFVSPTDLGVPENEMWQHISNCDVNRHWSAMICVVRGQLRGFFCEISASVAMLHENNPDWAGTGKPMEDIGVPIEPGWWKQGQGHFEQQIRTCCPHCAIPLRRPGKQAVSDETQAEEFSETHRFIAKPKTRSRPVEFVTIGGAVERPDRPATNYLPGTTPGYRG
jgi:hypothetical protein